MINLVRHSLYRALTSPTGDSLSSVRIAKNLARRLNAFLGRPLAPPAELAKRERARVRLVELRAQSQSPRTGDEAAAREIAPVLIYFETGRNTRELTRIEELLASKDVSCKRLDLSHDEATLAFVMRKTPCEKDDLPVVFVADRPVGNYAALVRLNVSGELDRLIFGESSRPRHAGEDGGEAKAVESRESEMNAGTPSA